MSNFPLDRYALPAAVTVAGMHQMVRFARSVGSARKQYNVQIPDTTGPAEFNRVFRAHQNSLEFYPLSLTSLWVGSVFFHPVPASVVYGIYLLGRKRFFDGYVESVEKRVPGFKLSVHCLIALAVMSAVGVTHKLVRFYGGIDLLSLLQEKVPVLKCS